MKATKPAAIIFMNNREEKTFITVRLYFIEFFHRLQNCLSIRKEILFCKVKITKNKSKAVADFDNSKVERYVVLSIHVLYIKRQWLRILYSINKQIPSIIISVLKKNY